MLDDDIPQKKKKVPGQSTVFFNPSWKRARQGLHSKRPHPARLQLRTCRRYVLVEDQTIPDLGLSIPHPHPHPSVSTCSPLRLDHTRLPPFDVLVNHNELLQQTSRGSCPSSRIHYQNPCYASRLSQFGQPGPIHLSLLTPTRHTTTALLSYYWLPHPISDLHARRRSLTAIP